jgi:hypothetical protein
MCNALRWLHNSPAIALKIKRSIKANCRTRLSAFFRGTREPKLLDEAQRQSQAANGVKIEWRISDERTARFLQDWLDRNGVSGIRAIFWPK